MTINRLFKLMTYRNTLAHGFEVEGFDGRFTADLVEIVQRLMLEEPDLSSPKHTIPGSTWAGVRCRAGTYSSPSGKILPGLRRLDWGESVSYQPHGRHVLLRYRPGA